MWKGVNYKGHKSFGAVGALVCGNGYVALCVFQNCMLYGTNFTVYELCFSKPDFK